MDSRWSRYPWYCVSDKSGMVLSCWCGGIILLIYNRLKKYAAQWKVIFYTCTTLREVIWLGKKIMLKKKVEMCKRKKRCKSKIIHSENKICCLSGLTIGFDPILCTAPPSRRQKSGKVMEKWGKGNKIPEKQRKLRWKREKRGKCAHIQIFALEYIIFIEGELLGVAMFLNPHAH